MKPQPPILRELDLLTGYAGVPRQGRMADFTTAQIHQRTLYWQNELYRRAAAGEPEAVANLLLVALRSAGLMAKLSQSRHDVLGPIARKSFVFPIALSRRKGALKEAESFLKWLGVGEEGSFNMLPSSRWPTDSPITELIFDLHLRLCEEQAFLRAVRLESVSSATHNLLPRQVDLINLPPFCRATADIWFEKALWPVVMTETNQEPEKVPELRKKGRYRQHHTNPKYRGPAGGRLYKSEESNIRDGIKTAFRQTYKSMANPRRRETQA